MRPITRKLLFMALAVGATMAFNISAAFAVSVVTESTGVACSTPVEVSDGVVSGGCPVRGVSTDLELGGPFGMMVECDVTLEGRAGGAGVFIATYTITSCEENLTVNCAHLDEQHVDARVVSGSGPLYGIRAGFCTHVETPLHLQDVHCVDVAGSLAELAGHNYRLAFAHTNKCPNDTFFSLQGNIDLVVDAAHPRIEVRD